MILPPPLAHSDESSTSLQPLRTWLIVLYVVLLVASALALVWVTVRDYHLTVDNLERQQLQLARSLDEHATRTFVSVEQGMQNIVESLETLGGVDQAEEYSMHILLRDKTALTPQTRGIITIDSTGTIRAHGLEYPIRRVNLADREYFSYHRTFDDLRLRIDKPLISRTDNLWLIPVTRRINRLDGSFGGVVLAGVEPEYFLSFYQSLKLAPTTRIELMRSDGMLLLNYPFEPKALGGNLREGSPLEFEAKRLRRASAYSEKDASGNARLTVFHASNGDLPLIIRVSVDLDASLAKFRSDLMTRLIAVVALMLIVTVLLYLLLRQLKRVEQIESRLHLTQFTVDEAPDVVLWADRGAALRYANRAAELHSGLAREELLHTRLIDLIPELGEVQWEALWDKLLQEKRSILNAHLRGAGGHLQPVEITLNHIEFDAEAYACCTLRDITEQQNTERELRRHRDHLQDLVLERTAEIRTVLDASPLAIMLSVKHTVRLVNPAFETLFGFEATDLIGMPTHSLYASAERYEEMYQTIWARISTGGVYRGEVELFRRDHSSFWAMVYAKALVPGDASKGVIAVIEDVTAQRIAAQALRQSERLKRTIIDTTADGFILIDAGHHIVDVNQAFCQLLGYRREDLIGQLPTQLWGDTAKQIFPEHLSGADVAPNHIGEVSISTVGGMVKPFLVNSAVIPDDDQQVEYAFAFLTNIAHLKEIEKKLLDSKEAAEAANIAKSAFLANMSHELRTPMHAILSFSEMGLSKAGKGETTSLSRYFERIHSSGNRLLVLLNDLLDMSRLEANRMTYDKVRNNLQQTVFGATQEIAPLLASRQLRLQVDESTLPLYAVFDRARLMQVVVNLLSNAIKFSPQDGLIEIEFIELTVLASGMPGVGLAIRDHGPGIPEGEEEIIFDKFIQSSRVRQGGGGTGLGLAISRQIMQDHGGEVSANNHPDGGAVFTLLLPADTRRTKH
ncbi:PAS domain S-box protein [Chitinolyticbacter meiyuanensis]|uniref:PAS domain S-box protein n=1 Tax=Chitinolyticbacter meiyuanensis TaxID=682798 RepID=UPI0011E5E8DC|nr:PAS domain S-box protein [Chitinolyticbacter meiyuanensis]